MKLHRWAVSLVATLLISAARVAVADVPPAEPATTQSTAANNPLELWKQRKKKEAIMSLFVFDWNRDGAFETGSLYRMPESTFTALPADVRAKLSIEVKEKSQALSDFGKDLQDRARHHQSQGNADLALKYAEALKRLGEAFSDQDKTLLMFKLHGDSLSKKADALLQDLRNAPKPTK